MGGVRVGHLWGRELKGGGRGEDGVVQAARFAPPSSLQFDGEALSVLTAFSQSTSQELPVPKSSVLALYWEPS